MVLKVIKKNSFDKELEYIKKYGHHFNKNLCWEAISLMKHDDKNPLSQDFVDTLLKNNSIFLKNNVMFDYLYVINMAYFDYYNSSIPDDKHLALFVKDYIDDEDGYVGIVFDRWLSDIKHKEINIDWNNMI